MGVLEPSGEAFTGEIPATPPGLLDLGLDSGEEDLFAENTGDAPSIFTYGHDLHDLSFKNILPVLPPKGELDLLGHVGWQQPPKVKKHCSGCLEDVKRDLNKLASAVDIFRVERDAVKKENEALKKEVETLKKLLKEKEEKEKGDVIVAIENAGEDPVEVLIRKKNFENARSFFNKGCEEKNVSNTYKYGVQSFSVSLPKDNTHEFATQPTEDLKRALFTKEYQSEQKTFVARNYLEIKPNEEKKETLRSRLNIRIKPKKKITEIITKLTAKFGRSKVIPEAPPITMFQRFEKTRVVWESDANTTVLA